MRKHGSRELTHAISLINMGRQGNIKPRTADRGMPFSVRWPNLDLEVFTSQIKQSSEIKVTFTCAVKSISLVSQFTSAGK